MLLSIINAIDIALSRNKEMNWRHSRDFRITDQASSFTLHLYSRDTSPSLLRNDKNPVYSPLISSSDHRHFEEVAEETGGWAVQMKERGGRMNDKRSLKRASDPLVLLPTEGTGSSIFPSPSLSFVCRALSAYLRRRAIHPSLLSLYSRWQIYNLVGTGTDLQRDQGDALYNSIYTEIEIVPACYKICK